MKTVEHALHFLTFFLVDYHPPVMPLQRFYVPFVKQWGGKDIKAIIYTDDGIAAFRTFEPTKSTAHLVRSNLISAGFLMSEDKSDFIPKTKEKWLSVTIDTINLIFYNSIRINWYVKI